VISASVLRTSVANLVEEIEHSTLLGLLPEERRRRLTPFDACAVANALRVAREAGLPCPLDGPRRLAILLVADFVPCGARMAFLEGPPPPGLASPTLFLHTSANFAAAQLAIALRSRGPSATFAGEEDALERALLWLAEGAAEEALVFGACTPTAFETAAVLLARDPGKRRPRFELAVARRGDRGSRDEGESAFQLLVDPPPLGPKGIPIGDRLWLRPSR